MKLQDSTSAPQRAADRKAHLPTEPRGEAAKALFEQLGRMAYDADLMCEQASNLDRDGRDNAIAHLQDWIRRMGWVADIGSRLHGGTGELDSAEAWMLDRPLREVVARAEYAQMEVAP